MYHQPSTILVALLVLTSTVAAGTRDPRSSPYQNLRIRNNVNIVDDDELYLGLLARRAQLSRRIDFNVQRIKESARGGEQTMGMLTTTPAGNHMLPHAASRAAGAVVGGLEAVTLSNSKSAPPRPMKPVSTTGEDRPKTKADYIQKATELAVNTAHGPLGNTDAKNLKVASKTGAIQGKVGYNVGSAFDRAAATPGKIKQAAQSLMKGGKSRRGVEVGADEMYHDALTVLYARALLARTVLDLED